MVFLRVVLLLSLVSLMGCTKIFYQPDHYIYFPPEKNNLNPKDVLFKSGDGTELHGWFFSATSKPLKGTIVQFHGNAQNISSHYASLVWLTRHGYNLFTFDYRGYGQSDGKPTQEGIYKDGMSALDQGWELHKKTKAKKFIVYGQSLGGAIAMRSFADFRRQSETKLIVMDSTFVSYKAAAQSWLATRWITWPISPLAQVLVSDEYSPEKQIPRLKTRLLVIHDKEDPIVPFKNGRTLYELATCPKDFWELDKGRHIGVFSLDTPENRERFLSLLEAI